MEIIVLPRAKIKLTCYIHKQEKLNNSNQFVFPGTGAVFANALMTEGEYAVHLRTTVCVERLFVVLIII